MMTHKLLTGVFVSCFLLLLASCIIEEKGEEPDNLRDFYLSQPRDPRLAGKWAVFNLSEDTLIRYMDFNDDGYIYYSSDQPNGEFYEFYCWYTLGDFILKKVNYNRRSRRAVSDEHADQFYKIEGGYLYFSSDGFSYDHRLRYKKVNNP